MKVTFIPSACSFSFIVLASPSSAAAATTTPNSNKAGFVIGTSSSQHILHRKDDVATTATSLHSPSALHAKDTSNENDDLHLLSKYFQKPYIPFVSTLSCNVVTTMMPSPPPPQSSSLPVSAPLRQELFKNPIIPALYERILPPLWEAGLRSGGPQVEYENAMSYLLPSTTTTTETTPLVALDLSCGTGFVARRMAASRKFQHVFALDYSKEMLTECISTLQQQKKDKSKTSNLYMIQGDATSLPFASNTIDVIHWGAAMHCVPNAEKALEEVYRVLKPNGGRVYITTFLKPFPIVVFRFFTVEELRNMATSVGFGGGGGGGEGKEELDVEGNGVYGILRATK